MDEADAKQADGSASDEGVTATLDTGSSSRRASDPRAARWKRRITSIALLATLIVAAVVLPPLINISHYKRQIAALMTRSMGRPVRMSRVELRLLPTPGFVLHDLQVSEDPQFGAEPILSARTVVASVRILALWRGKLEISRVSVDEASLNLVRSAQGRWNLESLMMGPTGRLGQGEAAGRAAARFPYLEATESRVNLKNGIEKSPYSLVDADLSLWQDAPGQWRARLRGQPVRTDIPMSLADTGEVRLEASLQTAAQLRAMPLKLEMEWRNAHLGQLSRLITGSDAGWRGDLTANIAVQGTPEDAQTQARLRATGVRRAEFAPETPLDFDANCSFRYQHSVNAAHEVNCNTAIGDGRLHVKAELPGRAGPPEAMLEVKDVPVQAALDLLRTVRSGFAPGISAHGTVNGSLTYKEVTTAALIVAEKKHAGRKSDPGAIFAHIPADLQGNLTVDGAELTGGELKEAIKLPRIVLTPTTVWDPDEDHPKPPSEWNRSLALETSFAVPFGTAALPAPNIAGQRNEKANEQSAAVKLFLSRGSYQLDLKGAATVGELRALAYGFGLPHSEAIDGFSGGEAEFEASADGPWVSEQEDGILVAPEKDSGAAGNRLDAKVTLGKTEWRASYLVRPVELSHVVVHANDAATVIDADFSYGSGDRSVPDQLHGSLEVVAITRCDDADGAHVSNCPPKVQLRFGAVDAAELQTALLGAPEERNLLSPLIDRMRAGDQGKWPELAVHAEAESLALGPVMLQKPEVDLRFKANQVVVERWEAGLLGGSAEGKGHFGWADGKPEYSLDGKAADVNAKALGALMGNGWTGGTLTAEGSVQLSGRTAEELSASAAGTLQFHWVHGVVMAGKDAQEMHFDDWGGTATIAEGGAKLGENKLRVGRRPSTLAGVVPFYGAAILKNAPPEAGMPAETATGAKPANIK